MSKILKYKVAIQSEIILAIPGLKKNLSFQIQDGLPTLWVEVFDHSPISEQLYRVFGTGHQLPELHEFEYVGTIQHETYVWHLYYDKMINQGATRNE